MKRNKNIVKIKTFGKSKQPGTGWSAGAEPEELEVEEPKLLQCQAPPNCGTFRQGPSIKDRLCQARTCGMCQGPWSRQMRRQASAASSPPVGLALS